VSNVPRHVWSVPVPTDVAIKRAGGRRRWNFQRQGLQFGRRMRLWEEFGQEIIVRKRGVVIRAARLLGVHPSTISRDIAWFLHDRYECPVCQTWVAKQRLEERLATLRRKLEQEWARKQPLVVLDPRCSDCPQMPQQATRLRAYPATAAARRRGDQPLP